VSSPAESRWYGLIGNEVPSEGRWISSEGFPERRRVVLLGGTLRKQLSDGRPAVGETEPKAQDQVRAAIGKRQRFSPTDKRAIQMFGREEFRPIIDGITIGLQVLLVFIGALTLGIGGVGVQFLAEALVLTLAGGLAGIGVAYLLAAAVGSLPLLGPAFKDTSGKGDIHPAISLATVAVSTGILVLVGVLSGLAPALRASCLDPAAALRYE